MYIFSERFLEDVIVTDFTLIRFNYSVNYSSCCDGCFGRSRYEDKDRTCPRNLVYLRWENFKKSLSSNVVQHRQNPLEK